MDIFEQCDQKRAQIARCQDEIVALQGELDNLVMLAQRESSARRARWHIDHPQELAQAFNSLGVTDFFVRSAALKVIHDVMDFVSPNALCGVRDTGAGVAIRVHDGVIDPVRMGHLIKVLVGAGVKFRHLSFRVRAPLVLRADGTWSLDQRSPQVTYETLAQALS